MGIREETLSRWGAELKAWREEQEPRLTQSAAAERVGASQGAWAAWERGFKSPDGYFAVRIEELTEGRVRASSWAYPRLGTKAAKAAAAPESGTDVTTEAARAS